MKRRLKCVRSIARRISFHAWNASEPSPLRETFLSPLSLSVPGTFANCDTNEERRHRSPPPLSSVRTLTFNISKTTRPFRNGIRDIEIKIKFG